MLWSYIKTAWRNLFRHIGFTVINMIGLALGITGSLLILLWVEDEKSIDRFHVNADRLYHVYERRYAEGRVDGSYLTQGNLAGELQRVVPEVEYATSLERNWTYNFQAGEQVKKLEGSFASPDFFNMFSYPLLEGTAASALNSPEAIAISRSVAEFFFGSAQKAMGKTIRYENKEDLQVTAVFDDISKQSSRRFDFLRSWKAYVKENSWVDNWSNTSPETFVLLKPHADAAKVEAEIKDFIYNYMPRDENAIMELALQPYAATYLKSSFTNGVPDTGRIAYVQWFSIIAFFILVIACINYMNLATARSGKRSREVGIRKVTGALRSTLIGQFISEAVMLAFLSLLMALLLTALLLPAFNSFTGKDLQIPFSKPAFWNTVLGLVLLTGLIAGSYPAIFLSSLKPVNVLKTGLKFSPGAVFLRKGLVVFQFTLSVILILAVIVIYKQMDYTRTRDIGYDRENLVYIPIEGNINSKYELFKSAVRNITGVQSVSKIRALPTYIDHYVNDIGWSGKDPNLATSFADATVGYDFVKTMGMELVAGHDFSKSFGADSLGFLLNETAVRKIGYSNPVGKPLSWGNRQGTIIGVVKDFHFKSMHQTIEPLVIRLDENPRWGSLLVRTGRGKTSAVLESLQKIYASLNPGFPFTYHFADQEYDKMYKSDQMIGKLSAGFAFLAIFISCLGLLGLSTFTAAQRTKEIGVRKVLGASTANILSLLSLGLLQPVAISLLLAFPVAWYLLHQWLRNFAYKISIQWWMFGLAALVIIGIALFTISIQSIRSAIVNPVKSLREE